MRGRERKRCEQNFLTSEIKNYTNLYFVFNSQEATMANIDDKPPQYQQGQAQPGYAPQPAQPGYTQPTTQTVVMQQPTMIQAVTYGSFPINVTCPRCQASIVTSVTYSDGLMVWMVAGGICLFGGWLGCCLIPFCINSLKDCTHSCPNCKNVIGSYKRM